MNAHYEWKERVADENRYIVVDAMNHVCMISPDLEGCTKFVSTSEKFLHLRVYKEIGNIRKCNDYPEKE